MRCRSLILFLISLAPYTALHAADNPALSLDQTISRMIGDSPQIRAQKVQVDLADGDRWRRYLPNEPQLSYTKDESDHSNTLGLSLAVGFPGKAFSLSTLDTAMAKKQRLELSAKQHELAVLAAQAYIECAAAQGTVTIREKTLNDLEAFLQSLRARRGITQTDKLSFELETRQARQDLLIAKDSREVSCQKLTSLLGESKSDIPTLTLPEDLNSDLIKMLSGQTAEESRMIAARDVAEATSRVAFWSQMPDLNFSYSQKRMPSSADPNNKENFSIYGISLTLPIFFPFYENNEVRRTRSQATIDRNAADLQRIQLESDRVEAARAFMRTKNYLTEIRRKDLPLGQALLESAYSTYRAGQIGYAEMVLSRKTLIDLRLKEIELRTQLVSSRLKCLDSCESLSTKARSQESSEL